MDAMVKWDRSSPAICGRRSQIEIVAGVDLYDGIKMTIGIPEYFRLRCEADVIIDFPVRRPWTIFWSIGVNKKIPVVLCTTGLSEGNRWSR